MSDVDKTKKLIDKWEQKKCEIDWSNEKEVSKEVGKIRLKTLRKVLLIEWLEYLFYAQPDKYELSNPFLKDTIKKSIRCGDREAYDFMRFNFLLQSLKKQKEYKFYEFVAKMKQLESKPKGEVLNKQ